MHRGGDSGERRIKPPSGGTRPPGLLPLPNAKLPLLLTWTTRPPLPSRGSARFALPPNPPPSHFQPRAPRPAPQASFSLAFPRPPGLIVTRQHGSMDSRATLNLGNASRRPGNPAAASPSPASPPPVAARPPDGSRVASAHGTNANKAPRRGATSDHRPVWPPPLECGGKTPLLDQATCRLVQKRRRISGPTPPPPPPGGPDERGTRNGLCAAS